LNVAAGEDSEH